MNKRIFLLAVSIMLYSALFCGCAKGGTELTVYTALEDEQIPVYLKSFEAQHPDIRVNIVRDSTGIITARLMAEKDNPVADLIWGTALTSLLILDEEGMLEPYAPAGLERVLPRFRDSRAVPHWVGIDVWMTGIVVNTIELEKAGIPIPLSYADLILPVYKGLIVMPHPASSGTGYLSVSAFIQLFGEEAAWEYMDALHSNVAMYTHSGSKPARMAGTGEYPVGISFGYRGIIQKQRGEPVHTVFPAEGSGWDMEANALIRKETIKEEAKLFLDWAISDAIMVEYNKNFALISIANTNPVPEGFPEKPLDQLIENDFLQAARDRDRILTEWNRRYGGKSE